VVVYVRHAPARTPSNWSRDAATRGHTYPAHDCVDPSDQLALVEPVAPFYTGNHRPNAFGLAVGPGIAPGATLEGAHILDLAPTLLAHLGIEVPAYMTGRVLHELWRPASAAAD
jgi:hypothetical protein